MESRRDSRELLRRLGSARQPKISIVPASRLATDGSGHAHRNGSGYSAGAENRPPAAGIDGVARRGPAFAAPEAGNGGIDRTPGAAARPSLLPIKHGCRYV